MEKVENDIMEHPPKPKDEGIFAHGLGIKVAIQGLMFAALTVGALHLGRYIGQANGLDPAAAGSTLAFMVLALCQVVQAYNMRSSRSLFKIGLFGNKMLNLAALVSLAMVSFVMFVPGVNAAFGMTYLPCWAYFVGLGFSLVPVLVMELSKAFGLIKKHHR